VPSNGLNKELPDGPQAVMEISDGQNTNLLTGLDTDEVIARYTQTGRTLYLQDALMSVIAQSRDDQSIQNFYGYSPFGEAVPTAEDRGNALEYTGRENDGTGLYYYRARYYDPILKRFVSEDPIGLAGGLNLYGYVGGSPTNLIDPTGNASTCYSAGPNCSGAGNGIYKQPSGGGCYKAVMRGGYIVGWEPCNSPVVDPCDPSPNSGAGAAGSGSNPGQQPSRPSIPWITPAPTDWDNFFPWHLSEPNAEDYAWCFAKIVAGEALTGIGEHYATEYLNSKGLYSVTKWAGRASTAWTVITLPGEIGRCIGSPRKGVIN
jgi:RHS repeat-associated protein